MNEEEEKAVLLLEYMKLIGQCAIDGHSLAAPYLESDAVRIVDGHPEFHKDRFLHVMAEQIDKLP